MGQHQENLSFHMFFNFILESNNQAIGPVSENEEVVIEESTTSNLI